MSFFSYRPSGMTILSTLQTSSSQSISDSQPCSYTDSALDVWSTGTHLPWSSSWYRQVAIPQVEASVTR